MFRLGVNIGLKSTVSTAKSALLTVGNLKAWYKFKTSISVDGDGNVSQWSDSSGNSSENMNLVPPATDNDVPFTSATGKLAFTTGNKSELKTASDQLNLGAFTIFCVFDIIESGASNEAIIGRAGNDELRFYRGSAAAGFRARINGINRDIDLNSSLPTGKLLFTIIRASGGLMTIRINGSTQTNTTTLAISNLFDFTGIGNEASDMDVFEIAVFDAELSASNITAVEADINSRNGL